MLEVTRLTYVNVETITHAEQGIKPPLCRTFSHPPWLADLFLRLLGLQGFAMGGVTVRAVMFTVVVCRFGIINDQKLLDVALWKAEEKKKISSG